MIKHKIFYFLMVALISNVASAGEWITVSPSDIRAIQISQSANSAAQPEGLYIALKVTITGSAASYCQRKDFVVITDPKLIDRAYSGYLYAISAQKGMKFYANGVGQCVYNGPVATMFELAN